MNALILGGGLSRRMGVDKATLRSPASGEPMLRHLAQLVRPYVEDVYFSLRPGQELQGLDIPITSRIADRQGVGGPLAGILGAMDTVPNRAWLILACDLPLLDHKPLQQLLGARQGQPFVAFANAERGFPEPLCTIYEPTARPFIEARQAEGMTCPRDIIAAAHPELLTLPFADALGNANTPEEWERLCQRASV
ncbi:MAG: molybdenum cofactor guanylyltransferase [Opitutales bacterium]